MKRKVPMHPLCDKCQGACCEAMLLRAPAGLKPDWHGEAWLKAHGTKLITKDGVPSYYIEHPCTHLKNGKCVVYDMRPKPCRDLKVDGELCRWTRNMRRE